MKYSIKTILFSAAALLATPSASLAQSQTSGIDKDNLDLKVKPGNDFFEYSCGGWLKRHPLTAEYSSYGVTDELVETERRQIHEMIERLASQKQEPNTLGQKIGSLYRLAMDSTRRNADGWQPLKPVLERVRAIDSRKMFQIVTAALEREGIDVMMFDISTDADQKDATMNLLDISQGGLTLGERDYYLNNDTATVKIREALKTYIAALFELIGYGKDDAQKKMEAVMAIETRIARASYDAVRRRDIEGNYHKMSYRQLVTDYPGIDWGETLLQSGIPAVEYVSVAQPEPIHEVEKILAETPLEDLKTYAEYGVLNDGANALDDRFREVSFHLTQALTGAGQDRPRWKRAVGAVSSVMGEAIGKMYVERYFPETSKQRILALVKNLQEALKQRIEGATWMSRETKDKAIEKLKNFNVKMGYPDKWKNYDGLRISDSLTYYQNLKNAYSFLRKDYVERHVNKPVDRSEWYMTPQTVNAYYNPSTNEICFPAGILQPPFFIADADDAYNYGAIGAVIGHEMTHGFDDQGSQFDLNGNVNDWWTAADKAQFKARTRVMANFFSNIQALPDLKLNGELTLGENLADNGGLQIAFLAFQNKIKEHPLPVKDGFTPEQRFFLAYGISWAESIRPEQLRMYNATDPHAPAKWRVNGALPHIDAWYKAFGIKKGDKLYLPKKKRVDVW